MQILTPPKKMKKTVFSTKKDFFMQLHKKLQKS